MKYTNVRRFILTLVFVSVAVALLTFIPQHVDAYGSHLDSTFDGDGKLTTAFSDHPNSESSAHAVATQQDGKIVVIGSSKAPDNGAGDWCFAIARYLPDGSLDRTFGGDGTVSFAFPGLNRCFGAAVEVESSGKIIVGGHCRSGGDNSFSFTVAKYNNDGSLDTSFDDDGVVVTSFGSAGPSFLLEIAIQPADAKIVAVGYTEPAFDWAIARYNPDGSLDASFDDDGRVTTDFGGEYGSANSVVVLPEGKILVGGSGYPSGHGDFALARYDETGALDSSFDRDGKVTTDFNQRHDGPTSMALQPDGKIVLAGSTDENGFRTSALVRYHPNGSLDNSFDQDGKLIFDGFHPTAIDGITDVAIQPDGKFVITILHYDFNDFVLARLNPSGSRDLTFGRSGILRTGLGGGYDTASAIAIQPDGRLVVVGSSRVPFASRSVFGAARYLPDNNRRGFDYDGDDKTDFSVFRPSEGAWYLQRSTAGFFGMLFGFSDDKITPADFDGDGKTDIAVFRPSDRRWYIANSADGTFSTYVFGLAEDVPAPADYDGDGKADLCVFRPSDGIWYRQNSGNGTYFAYQFGTNDDKPTIGDFDGDGLSDIAVFRPSNGEWYQVHSSDGSIHGEQFGFPTDKIVPADYDGDGKTDIAVFRPSDRIWYIKNSMTSTYTAFVFGLSDDIPTPGDYDGDGRADLSVFRPSDGNWYPEQRERNLRGI